MSNVKNILLIEPDRDQTISFNCPLCKSNNWKRYGEGKTFTCEKNHTFLFDIYLSCNGTVNLVLILS